MESSYRFGSIACMRFTVVLVMAGLGFGQTPAACPRPMPGAPVQAPVDLRSSQGTLGVDFFFRTNVDIFGLTLYCYITGDGVQSPTMRVKPGDQLVLTLKNELPSVSASAATQVHAHASAANACGNGPLTASSTNLHFHGLTVPPVCHQDEVIHTLIQPDDSAFEYRIQIPSDEPPGLYWYHPHPHGFSKAQVVGGASGALIVEGIENVNPAVAGLPERVIVLRDQIIGGLVENYAPGSGDEAFIPTLDISMNYVPVMYPLYKPAFMNVPPEQREFWRVLNASADTFFNLQLLYWPNPDTQVAQPMQVVAIDGVPVGRDFASVQRTSILLPPGARAEFLMTTPPEGMYAQFLTQRYNNGPFGDVATYRVLATIKSSKDAPPAPGTIPNSAAAAVQPFSGLAAVSPAAHRKLYVSEMFQDPADPNSPASYFITVDGATPKIFDMNFTMPDITVTQGTVEDWIIENRAQESHAFHIHQLHFQVLERDGQPVNESALRDTIDLPYWDGKSAYPSVKLRMDFRDPNIVGTFLYHCHILEHEDGGMMGSIQVVVPPDASAVRRRPLHPTSSK